MADRTFYIRFYPDGLDDDGTPFITANEDKEYPLANDRYGISLKVVIPSKEVSVKVLNAS